MFFFLVSYDETCHMSIYTCMLYILRSSKVMIYIYSEYIYIYKLWYDDKLEDLILQYIEANSTSYYIISYNILLEYMEDCNNESKFISEILHYLILSHIISYYLILSHIISCYLILSHIISYHTILVANVCHEMNITVCYTLSILLNCMRYENNEM